MLALTATHAGLSSNPALFIIAAITVAVFWRGLVKIGLTVLVVGFLFLLISGAASLMHGLP